MDSIDEDDYELEDGFADRGEAPPLQEQVMSIVQLMNELWKKCNKKFKCLQSYTRRRETKQKRNDIALPERAKTPNIYPRSKSSILAAAFVLEEVKLTAPELTH